MSGAGIFEETSSRNSSLSSQAIKLYSQGLTAETWTQTYLKSKTLQKNISHRQAHYVHQQINKISQSELGQEILKPLNKTGHLFQTFTNKIAGKLPKGFNKYLNYTLHPVQSIKGFIGKRIGKSLGRRIYKAFARKITNKTARLVAKTLLRKGIKQGTKILIKEGAKQVAKALLKEGVKQGVKVIFNIAIDAGLLTAEGALAATGVGIPLAILVFVLQVALFVVKFIVKKAFQLGANLAKSIWGEKIKARDFLALPAAGLLAVTSALAGLGAATAAAASSAVGTVAISAAAGIFLYITAFTVAPLISTIAQLEGQPGLEYSIAGPTGPIPPGCPSGWPTSGGVITQGPKTLSSHYATEAIDIGLGFGLSIYTTHPGRAVSGYSPSYGNYVDVYGICEGINYVTRYAHMPNLSFRGERLVNTGDKIGVVDNTGNSTGNHLHYEIRGGALGNINQFLPKHVPPGCIEEYTKCEVSIP